MKKEYDLSKLPSRRNPYANEQRRLISLRVGENVIEYFKGMAEDTGIPYQSLINLYLSDCVRTGRKLKLDWPAEK